MLIATLGRATVRLETRPSEQSSNILSKNGFSDLATSPGSLSNSLNDPLNPETKEQRSPKTPQKKRNSREETGTLDPSDWKSSRDPNELLQFLKNTLDLFASCKAIMASAEGRQSEKQAYLQSIKEIQKFLFDELGDLMARFARDLSRLLTKIKKKFKSSN